MPLRIRLLVLATAGLTGAAFAADYNSAASYNSGYGMSAGQENQAINPSLRDANGNLTIVNGQITSATFGQSGVQSASTLSSYASSTSGTSTTTGTATAIGNSLNVVTVGSYNTVIVNSTQVNNGNQTATVTTNGSSGK
jgi:holdfast attachment protein HfaA